MLRYGGYCPGGYWAGYWPKTGAASHITPAMAATAAPYGCRMMAFLSASDCSILDAADPRAVAGKSAALPGRHGTAVRRIRQLQQAHLPRVGSRKTGPDPSDGFLARTEIGECHRDDEGLAGSSGVSHLGTGRSNFTKRPLSKMATSL